MSVILADRERPVRPQRRHSETVRRYDGSLQSFCLQVRFEMAVSCTVTRIDVATGDGLSASAAEIPSTTQIEITGKWAIEGTRRVAAQPL